MKTEMCEPYKWYLCEDDNYWCEDDYDFPMEKCHTVVAYAIASWDSINDKVIVETFFNTRDNCPYGWGVLVDMGARFMIIKEPHFEL